LLLRKSRLTPVYSFLD